MRINRISLLIVSLLLLSVNILSAQSSQEGVFIPIGAGYEDTYEGLVQRIIDSSEDDTISILVIASSYSTNAVEVTQDEYDENMELAEGRRSEFESTCLDLAGDKTCVVTLVPLLLRDEALAPEALDYFTDHLDAIFILGGDQTIAMQILTDTPVEAAIAEAHASGTIIAGTSAGNAVQSRTMIGGYVGDFGPETGLNRGAVDIWNSDDHRGLDFGLTNIVLDQHFYERARLGRLLNVIVQPDVPHIGVGVDAYTAAVISNREIVGDVFGLYVTTVLDAETLHAYESAQYVDDILSVHNVLVHTLAPGGSTYNVTTRTHSLAAPLTSVSRSFADLTIPEGAGTLLLGGNLSGDLEDSAVFARFSELSGGSEGHILIIVTGFASERRAENTAEDYAEAFSGLSTTFISGENDSAPDEDYTGIIIAGDDKTLIDMAELTEILGERWQNGVPVLADHAAATVLGTYYANHPPTPEDSDDDPYAQEHAVQGSFINGATEIVEGLGWVNATFESSLLVDMRFGRLFSLAYAHPDLLAVGLTDNTALEINSDGATVLGVNGVFVFDFRSATLGLGENDGYVIANGLVDVFAPSETIEAADAEQ
jgi:cyanophycinase